MEPIGRSGERDDGLEKLEAFIAQLGASGSEFEKLAEEFGELKGEVADLEATLQKAGEAITQSVDLGLERLETAASSAVEAATAFAEAQREGVDRLGKAVITAFESLETTAQERLGQAMEELQQRYDQLDQAAFEALQQVHDEVDDLTEEVEGALDEAFSTFDGSLDELEAELAEAGEQASAVFDDVRSTVTDTFGPEMAAKFEDFGSEAESLVEDVQGGLDEAANAVGSLFEEVGGKFTTLADGFVGDVESIVTDSAAFAGETVKNELEKAAKETVEEIVQGLAEDTAISVLMMTTGSGITGAMSPILPQLAIAKNIVEKINDVLDAMNPFD